MQRPTFGRKACNPNHCACKKCRIQRNGIGYTRTDATGNSFIRLFWASTHINSCKNTALRQKRFLRFVGTIKLIISLMRNIRTKL